MADSLDKKVILEKFLLVFNTTHRARITVYRTPKKLTEIMKNFVKFILHMIYRLDLEHLLSHLVIRR